MEHSVFAVKLSQVKDILATSGMVQALHAWINHPPASSSLSSLSAMAMDLDEASSSFYSHTMSFNLWTNAHPPLALRAPTLE